MKELLVAIILVLVAIMIHSENAFGQYIFVNIPSIYSNDPLVIDGYEENWKDINQSKQQPILFKGISVPSSSSLAIQTNNTNALYGLKQLHLNFYKTGQVYWILL